MRLSQAAGYAPEGALDYFARGAGGDGDAPFWSSHPSGAERLRDLRGHIAALPAADGMRACPHRGWTLARVKARLGRR